MYPLTPVQARLNGLDEGGGGAGESSWTELAHRKPESWEWNELAAFVDIAVTSMSVRLKLRWVAMMTREYFG